jgi:hypothetical protein
MATPPAVKTTTQTSVSTTQRIALSFVIGVGVVVVGSALFAAAITWTRKDSISTTTSTAPSSPSTSQILGVDHTFVVPPAE